MYNRSISYLNNGGNTCRHQNKQGSTFVQQKQKHHRLGESPPENSSGRQTGHRSLRSPEAHVVFERQKIQQQLDNATNYTRRTSYRKTLRGCSL